MGDGMFIVFDLDGTLANGDHRIHHILKEPKDWRAFFAACGDDAPIPAALATLEAFTHAPRNHRVEIWTGRSDEVRAETEQWFADHVGHAFERTLTLRMRKAGDHRHDDVLKAEWIERHGKPDLVFEDRARVVAMWRANGIPCFQVAPGEF